MADVGLFLQFLRDTGHLHARVIPGGRYAAVMPFAFTVAIIVGRLGDTWGYADRWCYHDLNAAIAALDCWDGQGEPTGWHRQPGTGRRLAETEDCVDETGKRVPLGTIYVRH
jgi:hypothetical protein